MNGPPADYRRVFACHRCLDSGLVTLFVLAHPEGGQHRTTDVKEALELKAEHGWYDAMQPGGSRCGHCPRGEVKVEEKKK